MDYDDLYFSDLIRYFECGHLPHHLQVVSSPFQSLAFNMNALLPNGEEKAMALRKLLESKDCAVRAMI